ncbi:MAG: phosphate acyltransferase, partial [Celeribacter marinus]
MGGDSGPAAIVAGISRSAAKNANLNFIVHGDEAELTKLVKKRKNLKNRVEIRATTGVVTMGEKPSIAMRRTDTSMRSAIDAVRDGEAQAVVSCGNTGALMATSMIRLRKLEGVNRPAIACL